MSVRGPALPPRSVARAAFAPQAAVRAPVAPAARSSVPKWGKWLTILILLTWGASIAIGFQNALLALTLLGFATAVFGVFRPGVGLLGVGMLCTVDPVARAYLLTGGLWRWNTFNYWLLIVMLLSLPLVMHLRDPQSRLVQIFALVLSVDLLQSEYPMSGLQDVFNVITVFGLMAYFSRAEKAPETSYWMGIVTGFLSGAGGLIFFIKQEDLPEVNPNAWSFFPLTAIFAITLAFATGRPMKRGRILLAALAAVNGVWVFLSASRGSFLIAIVCLVFILFQLRKTGSVLPILGVGVLVAAAAVSQFVGEESWAIHRFDKLLNSDLPMANRTSGRSDLALGGWYMFQQHPFGVGTGGFGYSWISLNRREGLSGFRQGEFTPAHSGWIKVLAENGVPGILVFTAFVFSFAVVGWRKRWAGVFPLGLLVTASLCVAFLADEFQGKGLWLLVAAVMTILRRVPVRPPRTADLREAAAERPISLRGRAVR